MYKIKEICCGGDYSCAKLAAVQKLLEPEVKAVKIEKSGMATYLWRITWELFTEDEMLSI